MSIGTGLAGTSSSGMTRQSRRLILDSGTYYVKIIPNANDSTIIIDVEVMEECA